MSSQLFPNGDVLVSSALTPDEILAIFQGVVAHILGYDTTTPDRLYFTVHAGAGGSGYAVGDTVFPQQSGGAGAVLAVASISGGDSTGPAETLTVTGSGLGYGNGIALPTATLTGSGTGLQVDIVSAYFAVRIGWQPEGQPAWTIGQDLCSLEAYTENEPYSKVRDGFYTPNDDVSVAEQMGYSQVWKIRFVFRGPNAADHARLLVSAMSLDFVHDALADSNIFAVAEKNRPVYVPELFQGQWWKRADVELQFNELVSESLTVPSAAEADVTLIKDTGLTAGVTMTVPQ